MTWYFVLYLGWTLDFIPRSWSFGRQRGQDVDGCPPGPYDPCTNAADLCMRREPSDSPRPEPQLPRLREPFGGGW